MNLSIVKSSFLLEIFKTALIIIRNGFYTDILPSFYRHLTNVTTEQLNVRRRFTIKDSRLFILLFYSFDSDIRMFDLEKISRKF